jgi:hypothetical protein
MKPVFYFEFAVVRNIGVVVRNIKLSAERSIWMPAIGPKIRRYDVATRSGYGLICADSASSAMRDAEHAMSKLSHEGILRFTGK